MRSKLTELEEEIDQVHADAIDLLGRNYEASVLLERARQSVHEAIDGCEPTDAEMARASSSGLRYRPKSEYIR